MTLLLEQEAGVGNTIGPVAISELSSTHPLPAVDWELIYLIDDFGLIAVRKRCLALPEPSIGGSVSRDAAKPCLSVGSAAYQGLGG